ncbi:Acetyltransferase (GNAT) domain-containing protein [Hymenobacter daecheongensis DSM 21074]|uniref:Acetyltransferase (GNAT) domain-containing protein n=1 Tax=Hymenobacter daecheongensis DSM 21074 TaxID=1121955 RepID=A0A1M6KGE9_9BACT|nr:GNAT family N-acetyltransferase [Hymenobacter daecheongensis]SHJ58004.1 Acetyltransferase (GNAT) domain-containing protein [Hymenobacter daecheongensis DSM 21074]
MHIFVETDRLILRELLPTDEAAMFEMDADPEVHRYLGNKPVTTIEQSRALIAFVRQQYVENGIGRWAVVEKQTGAFVGWSGLKLVAGPTNGRTNYHDLGYRFLRRYWGRGYATETAVASVRYGFDVLRLPRICGIADVRNVASNQVLQKAGLRFGNTFDLNGLPHHWYEQEQP